MSGPDQSCVIHLAEAQAGIPGPGGERAITLVRHGTLDLKFSLPLPPNQRKSHEQDEIYIVVRGRGFLLHQGKRDAFNAGDCLFVAAGTEHQFEDFSDDVAVWILFYGARGGELPS